MPVTLVEYAESIPPPLNTQLVALSPYLAGLVHILRVLAWESNPSESWLLLAAWWLTCIFANFAFRYCVPLVFALALARPPKSGNQTPQPATEQSIQSALNDLQTLIQLLQLFRPTLAIQPIPFLDAARLALALFPVYLAFQLFIRARVLVGLFGTVILTWNSKWFQRIRSSMWRSAWIRYVIFKFWSLISRNSPPSWPFHEQFSATGSYASYAGSPNLKSTELRFVFTILENQRWWMGLDWTAALLPSERPSWSTTQLQPVSPPDSFGLPSPVTSFLPHPSRSAQRLRRQASWIWEESEWKVVLKSHQPPAVLLQRVVRSLPNRPQASEDGVGATNVMQREQVDSVTQNHRKHDGSLQKDDGDNQSIPKHTPDNLSDLTDSDGWIYGDNKWEQASERGGLGKYTRFRRWTRIAILREEVEEVGPGEMGVIRSKPVEGLTPTVIGRVDTSPTTNDANPSEPASPDGREGESEKTRDRLRQRLKAAVRGTSMSVGRL